MFETFGISAQAESAYSLLLADPGLDPSALTLALDGPADAAVAELIERGLVTPHQAKGRRFRVEPPERALELLIAQEEAALEARRAALADLRGGVADLVAEFVNGRSEVFGGLIEQVIGADAVRSRLYQLAVAARREVWTVNPGPAPSRRALAASRSMDELTRARGVRSRSIFSTAVQISEAMREYLGEVVAAGDEVRLHPDPPVLLFVIDGETAVVPVDTESPGRGALVLHSPALVQPLIVLHRTLWQAAQPFDGQGEAWDAQEDRLHRIVAMLAEGHKDETIARRLDLSVRTVRRLISLAVERLAAESRFQAGVHAARRGWVRAEG
ncbi:DNA-binding CsgD family transcriptional regulator [Allocatelliglobosispora scoriae]|uniref:DNA-binding CsgD family transcriptional regulator n=1 Tax=Allocatelliglobosispora scoriae TaxID=643052 RepID=A0A841BU91_9ACTN|nr:helix-turn-helix transcriptional regulator [Allocatelliglobosispora scoriae]MBB5870331.1 DNA-binding CsgD family transcriptional regulator [Allocatelliglobosispora scoriae]